VAAERLDQKRFAHLPGTPHDQGLPVRPVFPSDEVVFQESLYGETPLDNVTFRD